MGQLVYGMVHTMIGILYALNVVSRYGNNPGPRHIKFPKHLLQYVKYAKSDRLVFHGYDGPRDIETMTSLLQLRFKCDADLGGNPDNSHSQTAYLGYLGRVLVFHRPRQYIHINGRVRNQGCQSYTQGGGHSQQRHPKHDGMGPRSDSY